MLLDFAFLDLVIQPPDTRGVLDVFLCEDEELELAVLVVTLTLANTSRRIVVLNMTKKWSQLLQELYVVGDLLQEGSQLTTRYGVCLVQL